MGNTLSSKLFFIYPQKSIFRDPYVEDPTEMQPTVATVSTHTMGESLHGYLLMKIHPQIQNHIWSKIIIKGLHTRTGLAEIASIEKVDKPFNWQRPTATVLSPGVLQLNVWPGVDYVEHYANIIATHLSLQGRDPSVVQVIMPTPKECMEPLLTSNLAKMGPADVVIIGYVDGLTGFTGSGVWEYGDKHDELFAWQKKKMSNGLTVAFLGCRICFWGDSGGNVVRALQALNGVKCVFYVGKLGALKPDILPNLSIATGNQSFLRNKIVTWENPLEKYVKGYERVRLGVHYSLPSVLDETNAWRDKNGEKFDWVDPEIGHMADASVEGGTMYGFLHIVSDNLAKKYAHDLSNERVKKVRENRRLLLDDIESILGKFFEGFAKDLKPGVQVEKRPMVIERAIETVAEELQYVRGQA
ncbi:hypothetical protein M501DRAFT_995342 [Patellaria atrata CBS 101060]|uniref:Uncharacterized protein n=1 Tax=Patellaria atrata CBS 101060 TaxID=1346257 RepID=A0A9P4VRD2_9PEZI|nr:hypothetical protein M501DRAFT_995342 [Patellaria atrata CBS 101060]